MEGEHLWEEVVEDPVKRAEEHQQMINEFIADKRKKYEENQKRLADPAAITTRELTLTGLAEIEIMDE